MIIAGFIRNAALALAQRMHHTTAVFDGWMASSSSSSSSASVTSQQPDFLGQSSSHCPCGFEELLDIEDLQ